MGFFLSATMADLRKTSSSPKSGEERIPPLHFPFSSFSLSLPLSYSTLLSSLFHHSICLPILDTWVPLSFFLTICTGLSKRNGAKLRELSDNFPKLADWAVHGRSLCLATLVAGVLKQGTIILHRPLLSLFWWI